MPLPFFHRGQNKSSNSLPHGDNSSSSSLPTPGNANLAAPGQGLGGNVPPPPNYSHQGPYGNAPLSPKPGSISQRNQSVSGASAISGHDGQSLHDEEQYQGSAEAYYQNYQAGGQQQQPPPTQQQQYLQQKQQQQLPTPSTQQLQQQPHRKPVLTKEPPSQSSTSSQLRGLFHRNKDHHNEKQEKAAREQQEYFAQQQQLLQQGQQQQGPPQTSPQIPQQEQQPQQQHNHGFSIARKLSVRKSQPAPVPPPTLPRQSEERESHEYIPDQQQQNLQEHGLRQNRPQSYIAQPQYRDQNQAIASGDTNLKRSDTEIRPGFQRSDSFPREPQPQQQQQQQQLPPAAPPPPPQLTPQQQYQLPQEHQQVPHQQQQQGAAQHISIPQNQQQQPPQQPQYRAYESPTQSHSHSQQQFNQQQHQQQQQLQPQDPSQSPQSAYAKSQYKPVNIQLPPEEHDHQQQQLQQGGIQRKSQEVNRDPSHLSAESGGLSAFKQSGGPVSPNPEMPGTNNPGDGQRASTPTKQDSGSGMSASQVQALLGEFDVLQGKYRKVKNLYFDRAAEIERLQNVLANQRLSQSRTALDDNEYVSRFDRLDGAIKNLAFEIRQSWKVIPGWLQPVVNQGAEVKGGREMTVVGRAAISRWVVDEILDRFFHPGLDPMLSSHLKTIEHNIRRCGPPPQSVEEDDALSSKVCAWRMSTVDGVQSMLGSPAGQENRAKLLEHLQEKLVASLAMHLHEPTPAGVQGGVHMIVEIAIGIAANLPMESRDVRVWYPLPGEKYDTVFMRGESGLPPLTSPMDQVKAPETETAAVEPQPAPPGSKDGLEPDKDNNGLGLHASGSVKGAKDTQPSKKPSVLKGIRGKLSGATQQGGQLTNQQSGSQTSLNTDKQQVQSSNSETAAVVQEDGQQPQDPPKPAQPAAPPGQEKVRVAGFMAVEVRGKSILIKAPVWI